jgi:CubicO group peptidase (beta-lactamase class C family)
MIKNLVAYLSCTLLFSLTAIASSYAKSTVKIEVNAPSPNIMVGLPPSASSQVTFKNYRDYPMSKWAFNHIGATFNLLMIPRAGEIDFFKENKDKNIGETLLTLSNGKQATFAEIFEKNDADGIVFIKNNQLKYEQYWGYGTSERQHIWFSATKSLVSAAFGILVDQGKVDLSASPADYIPELKNSGFARTSIQNILNHSSAISFKENYTDLNSDFLKYYAPALNMSYIPGGRDVQPEHTKIYGTHDFLTHFVKGDKAIKPGDVFDYNSANADVIGWLVARISGLSLNEFIAQNIWSKLAVEHDAAIAVDRAYMPVATGGMNTTARDAARFGQMILNDGVYNGKQVIPSAWVKAITELSDKDKSKMIANNKYKNEAWQAYKNMWWLLDAEQGEFAAVGVYGQVIYINKAENVVISFFSSQAKASSANNQQFRDKLMAIRQLAKM